MGIRAYFYVKYGSTTRTFTWVFIHTKTYNTGVFIALKHKNNYVLTAKNGKIIKCVSVNVYELPCINIKIVAFMF